MTAKITISKARLRSLEAAEALAQHVRIAIADRGFVGRDILPYLDQWMRRTGKATYQKPKRPSPTWCPQCRCRHVYGEQCPPTKDRP